MPRVTPGEESADLELSLKLTGGDGPGKVDSKTLNRIMMLAQDQM